MKSMKIYPACRCGSYSNPCPKAISVTNGICVRKGDALDIGLKLTEQAMKILELIVNHLILIRWVISLRNAAGYNNWHHILIIGVHGAGELPVLLTEDQSEVHVGPEVVASFCYLSDMLSAGGGYELVVTSRLKTAGSCY